MSKKDNNKDKNKGNFFKELKSELKKVTWPTFKKLVNNTSAVISIVLIVAVIVFVLDVCFENLDKFGVEKLKTAVSSDTEETTDTDTDTDSEDTEESTDLGDGIELVTEEESGTDESTEETTDESTDETSEEISAEVDSTSETSSEEVTQ